VNEDGQPVKEMCRWSTNSREMKTIKELSKDEEDPAVEGK
jgi:hypothetical protein